MSRIYSTWDEAVDMEVIQPLKTWADPDKEYDIDSIAGEVLEWADGYDPDPGIEWTNRQGWRMKDMDEDEFWDVVWDHQTEGVDTSPDLV